MIAKYETVAADIQRSIEDGALKPGDKLPTVVEICEIYSVSKITVRRAIEQLVEQGLVSSKRGSGTYVKELPSLTPGSRFFRAHSDRAGGFTQKHQDEKIESVVYQFEIENPSDYVAKMLNITEDDFVYHIVRVRKANGLPIAIEYTYMPLDVIPGLKKSHLYSSIYQYINTECPYKISSFHRNIRAVGATEEEAERLEVKPGEPMLEFEQIGFLDNGSAFEYSVSRNVGSRHELYNVTLS